MTISAPPASPLSALLRSQPRRDARGSLLHALVSLLVVATLLLWAPRAGAMLPEVLAGGEGAAAHACCALAGRDASELHTGVPEGTGGAQAVPQQGEGGGHGLACATLCAGGMEPLPAPHSGAPACFARVLPPPCLAALPEGRGEGPVLPPPRRGIA